VNSVCKYAALPPKSATQTAYGTATPTVRIRAGNSSAYVAGATAASAPMQESMTDIDTASCHAESCRSHVMGK
jgi:hypothetical protein